jgi:NAD(P)-dependent dehydrogenase (short-subunit alcohol dehydrogenase family)/acyl dehydratase/putative sterol carrier protein
MGLLDGKVAIITGAGGGLGRAYALLFASEGCKVVVNDLGGSRDGTGGDSSMADQVVGEVKEAGGEAVANYASVAEPEGADSMVQTALDTWGRLDIVVNNAGILRDKTLLKLETDHFDLVLHVHARGTFLVTKAATAAMKELGNGGSIINTSSIAGLKGNFGQTNYACAKAGIAGMTRVWAQELVRYGIRTNAIAPMAKTRMTDDIDAVPEDITPEMIAPVALFLASDLSKDVNGRIFGAHGRHVFEYHMMLSPGLEHDTPLWTAQEIAERLDEIAALPSADNKSEGADDEMSLDVIIDEIFQRMPDIFVPERAADWSATIHFELLGTASYTVTVSGGECKTTKGAPDNASCTITYDSGQTLVDTVSGKTNSQQAFMNGQIKADNMGDLMKFAQCFDMKKGAAMAKARGGDTGGDSTADQVAQIFQGMPEFFLAERAADWSAVMHFDIQATGSYTVTVKDGACTTSSGKPEQASCTITYDEAATLLGSVAGKINPQQAFMQGKIKADNMGDLMKFAQCFDMSRAKEVAKTHTGGGEGSQEGMNKDAIGTVVRGSAEFVRPGNIDAYAKATNDLNPAYVNGGDVIAPVLYPVRHFHTVMGQAAVDPKLNADLLRLVHGEQDMRFYDTLKPWDLVAARAIIDDIEIKSSGELVKIRQKLMRDGEVVCETVSGLFIRAKKKEGETSKKESVTDEAQSHDLLFETTYTVDDDQSYRYAEASLDNNPIHVDEKVAKAAGHPGVIMHGLCTMAMTTRELVNQAAGGDPTRLQRLKVRFSKIVLPGHTLTTRAWLVENNDGVATVGFETVNQDGDRVISNALAEIRDA